MPRERSNQLFETFVPPWRWFVVMVLLLWLVMAALVVQVSAQLVITGVVYVWLVVFIVLRYFYDK